MIPYSAAQLYSYEIFKRCFADANGELPVQRRLAAGACAGMASTLVRTDCNLSLMLTHFFEMCTVRAL